MIHTCAAAGGLVQYHFVYFAFSGVEVKWGLGVVLDATPFPVTACSSGGRWGCAHSCDGSDGGCDPATGACSCEPGFTGEHCQLPKCPPPQHVELPSPSSGSCVFLMAPRRNAPRLFRPRSARRGALGFQQG